MDFLSESEDIKDYETARRGPHTVHIKVDWKALLLDDLMDDFRDVSPSERRSRPGGRVEHFSYLPKGAPGRVFVRRSVRGGLIGALMRDVYLGARRPLRELRAAAAAREAGVAVAEILAVRATRVCGPLHRFMVVSREVPDAANLLDLAPRLFFREKRETILRLADELRRLHDAGIYHPDLTLKNILRNGSGIFLVDFDKALAVRRRRPLLGLRNLSRLNRSVEKLQRRRGWVTLADKLRFLRRYLGGRERLKETARFCQGGLGFHRLWWLLSGRSP